MTTATETGLFNIHTEDIQFPGGFSDEVTALQSNKGMPVISEEDFAERTTTGDDEDWNAAMYARYAPQYTYAGTTN